MNLCAFVFGLLGVLFTLLIQQTSTTPSGNPQPAPSDPRLAKRITLHAANLTLEKALAAATKQSRVPLRASSEVKNLRLAVFVNDLPLSTFQKSLAELLHLTWKTEARKPRQDKGADTPADAPEVWGYLLYASPKNRAEAEELVRRGEEGFRRGIERAIASLNCTPKELELLKKEAPTIYSTLTNPSGRAATALLAQLSPAQRNQLYKGANLTFSTNGATEQGIGVWEGFQQALSDSNLQLARTFVPKYLEFRAIGEGADSHISVSLVDDTSASGSTVMGSSFYEVYGDLAPVRAGNAYARDRRPLQIPEEIYGTSLEDLLGKLAETLNLNIIVEHFPLHRSTLPRRLLAEKTTLENAFESIRLSDEMWWKSRDVYLFQRQLWFRYRLALLPAAEVERLKKRFKAAPNSLETWAELGRLRTEQWRMLQGYEVAEIDHLLPLHPLLAFYAHLPKAERERLFEPDGLAAATLSPADQERLQHWASLQSRADAPPVPPNASYRVIAVVKNRETEFSLIAFLPNGAQQSVCAGSLPATPSK